VNLTRFDQRDETSGIATIDGVPVVLVLGYTRGPTRYCAACGAEIEKRVRAWRPTCAQRARPTPMDVTKRLCVRCVEDAKPPEPASQPVLEVDPEIGVIDCPTCGGAGVALRDRQHIPCPKCRATGYVVQSRTIPIPNRAPSAQESDNGQANHEAAGGDRRAVG
jgi:hypothetical protein